MLPQCTVNVKHKGFQQPGPLVERASDTSEAAPHPTAQVTQLPLFHPQKEHAHRLEQLPSNHACPEAPSTEPYTKQLG